jgi:hypothetical protein
MQVSLILLADAPNPNVCHYLPLYFLLYGRKVNLSPLLCRRRYFFRRHIELLPSFGKTTSPRNGAALKRALDEWSAIETR